MVTQVPGPTTQTNTNNVDSNTTQQTQQCFTTTTTIVSAAAERGPFETLCSYVQQAWDSLVDLFNRIIGYFTSANSEQPVQPSQPVQATQPTQPPVQAQDTRTRAEKLTDASTKLDTLLTQHGANEPVRKGLEALKALKEDVAAAKKTQMQMTQFLSRHADWTAYKAFAQSLEDGAPETAIATAINELKVEIFAAGQLDIA